VVTIDGDLQDDPAEIPRLLAKLDEGFDLVSGWKTRRRDPLSRRILSRIFNRVTSAFSGVRLHDMNCGLKAYRAEVVHGLRLYGELHRFIPVLAASASPSCPSTTARASTAARGTASSATCAASSIS
jgi:glycosyltransferase involved in cell wall biosynthesis